MFPHGLIPIQVFLGDVVFRDLAGGDFGDVGVGGVFYGVDHSGFESLPFFEEFLDALGVGLGRVG